MKWKATKQWPELYEVSDTGLVRNKNTKHIWKVKEDHEGYVRYGFTIKRKSYMRYAHRLVAEAFIPNKNDLPVVHHKNNVRNDNRVSNLMWTTKKVNRQFAYVTCPHCQGQVKV